ncbi:tRNA (guanosine(37)-N1)-methyltransferase TrmD [Fervidibacillus halotolerans]|uniref:tRNA (guanine-N(1)-)-methyltransferase n=1 Tax=Fervidibacillus halotolerans TaxID=2980027 RepID=A0A9E8S1K6_9BACI|nr:tRNA (guanosine(37)-N1)-methyltransferase TrmD [Fervidibacillus halotolerans]WAA13622.1 tRNA (guanosine(37)-N1)-methyltransferase TrmD [Fervidibacillus halotolerans]
MQIDILTLFPNMFTGVLNESILKKAREKGTVRINVIDFRKYANNKHQSVDDYPYGGGAGMVLKPEPIYRAVDNLLDQNKSHPRIILLTPQGERYTQKKAEQLAQEDHLILICGHYEGFDERIRNLATDEISIGDFVLTGGELGAMVLVDSIVRLLPGVLGNNDSPINDSFSSGLLEHPHYTRPREFRGMTVPDVLLSGDHKKIAEWRKKESIKRTFERRPDLLNHYPFTEEEKRWFEEIKKEKKKK